jgi:hypothetical protein
MRENVQSRTVRRNSCVWPAGLVLDRGLSNNTVDWSIFLHGVDDPRDKKCCIYVSCLFCSTLSPSLHHLIRFCFCLFYQNLQKNERDSSDDLSNRDIKTSQINLGAEEKPKRICVLVLKNLMDHVYISLLPTRVCGGEGELGQDSLIPEYKC